MSTREVVRGLVMVGIASVVAAIAYAFVVYLVVEAVS
jgi:hypothetical protein